MRKTAIASSVRRGLLKRGFDRTYVNRIARELEEHWLDLVSEGQRQGLAESEAELRATESIGTAEPLIEEFTARMRRSSWLGRHPIPGFALLALVATILWWTFFIVPAGSVSGVFTWSNGKPIANLISAAAVAASVDWVRWASYFALPWLICYIARRFHCGWKAALWGCLVLGLHNAMHNFAFSPGEQGHGSISWGYNFSFARGPAWLSLFAPMIVLALDLLWNSRPEPRTDPSKNVL